MKESEVETIIQRAREQFPGERPRIISDNGPQFIAKDFKEFIRICGMTHVRTSLYYPQSNGKMERWYKTLKGGCIRVKTPLSLDDARRLVAEFVNLLQHRPLAQRHRLHYSGGQAGRSRRGNLGGEETEAGEQPTPGGEPRPRRRKWTSHSAVRYTEEAWAEDRATRGRDLSADPGPRPERAARSRPTADSGIGSKAINPFTILVPCRLP